MRKVTAVTVVLMMCVTMMAAGCGKSDEESAEATEATEEVSEIAIVSDAVEESPTENVEVEIEEYDFSVTEETSEEPAPVSDNAVAETDEYGITTMDEVTLYATEAVRMRTEPNTDSEVAGKLTAGEEVVATGKSEEWHRIKKGNGDIVYVKSEYLTETKPDGTEAKKEEEKKEEEKKEEKKTETAADNATNAATTTTTTTTTDTAATTTDTSAADAAAAKAAEEAAAQAAAAAAAQAASTPTVTAGTTINCTDGALVVNSKQMDVINKYWGYTGDAVEMAGHHSKGQLQELFAVEGAN